MPYCFTAAHFKMSISWISPFCRFVLSSSFLLSGCSFSRTDIFRFVLFSQLLVRIYIFTSFHLFSFQLVQICCFCCRCHMSDVKLCSFPFRGCLLSLVSVMSLSKSCLFSSLHFPTLPSLDCVVRRCPFPYLPFFRAARF